MKIQTIHGFCERVLRKFPLEAGIDPRFSVIDDTAASILAAEARAAVAELAQSGPSIVGEAYSRFAVALDFKAFEGMFHSFEARRDQISAYQQRLGGLEFVLADVLNSVGLSALGDPEALEAAAVTPPALDLAGWKLAASTLAASASITDQKRAVSLQSVVEAAARGEAPVDLVKLSLFTDAGEPAKILATKAIDPGVAQFLRKEQERVVAVFEMARANRIAKDTTFALALGAVYVQAYERAKSRRGVLDFADLITRARALMSERPDAAWVLYKLDGGIDHILVDEAQDTAPDQWEIIRALTGEFFVGQGKTQRVLNPTIFAVGDEKQSIFSFQGAVPERLNTELAYYLQALAHNQGAFKEVSLSVSRRSVQEVLTFVDATFEPPDLTQAILPPRPGGSANDNRLLEHIANRAGHEGCVDLWPLEREDPAEERRAWDEPLDAGEGRGAYRRLAESIATEIVDTVNRGDLVYDKQDDVWRTADYGDVLILVRKRAVLFTELIRALKQAGAPVAGADRLALAQTAVFEDLLAVVRFILFPSDDLNLAGVLRSPFCSVSDAELYSLAFGRSQNLWQTLLDRRSEQHSFTEAVSLLEGLISDAPRRTPFDLIARLIGSLDGQGRSMRTRLSTRLGPEAQDALDETLAQVLALEGRGVRDLEGLAHALAGLAVTVKREMDEPRGQVRVMTTHGAKGLEAPIVFLPETVVRDGGRSSPLLETLVGGFLWSAKAAEDCAAAKIARKQSKKRADDEAMRLLYVALTRSRDRLVIAGRIGADNKVENLKGWWPAVAGAFSAPKIGEKSRPVASGKIHFQRFGPDPRRGTMGNKTVTSDIPSPAWLSQLLPKTPAARFASPSQALEEDPNSTISLSPLARVTGLGRLRRGEIIHRLLQLLPDLPPDARPAAAEALLAQERALTEAQRQEMARAAFLVLNDPQFARVFAAGSRAEAALVGTSPKLPAGLNVSGRMDRLLVENDRVLVVDFKTNRPAPSRVEDTDLGYITQMAIYTAVLGEIFPGRPIEAALVWTDGPKLMAIPEKMMAQALAALAKDG